MSKKKGMIVSGYFNPTHKRHLDYFNNVKALGDLSVNQEKLTKTERVKLFVTLSNYIYPITKSVRNQFTIE